ncbi:unnamed protein product [Adineta ricciae]|uniref:Uncharacterized protein n=1 Tax=Adineta ricciae TaxID=249248 RepID=A0A815NNB7_ADIRI|nr:unnamed protein product [Adineta ricciae]
MFDSSAKKLPKVITSNQSSHRKQWAWPLSIFFALVTVLLLILTIVFAILYGTERIRVDIHSNSADELCLTPYCIRAAHDFLEHMDETVNPCENFYEFACGNWKKKARIPSDADFKDTFEEMQKQVVNDIIDLLSSPVSNITTEPTSVVNARQLYASCIDEQSIETDGVSVIQSFIDTELGGWPILLGSNWDASTFDLSRLLLKLNQYNTFLFFDIDVSIDEKNSSNYCIYVSQSSLGLVDRSYYMNDTQINQAYRDYMKNLASALTNETSMIEHDIIDMYDFEKQIAEYFWTTAQQYAADYNRTTYGNLSSLMNTSFDWTDYLRRAFLLGNVTLVDEDVIMVSELDVLRNMSLIITQQSSRTLQNYLVWRFMMNQVNHMPKRFRAIKQEFTREFHGILSEQPRSVQCTQFLSRSMGLVVSRLYITKYFDKDSRKEALEMIDNIRYAYGQMMNQSTWMDSLSKGLAMEKLQALNQRIGYPNGLDSNNVTDLENKYAEYIFNETHMQHVLKILRLKARNSFQKLRKPIDRNAWSFILPIEVNAAYSASLNHMTFTAAILQPPMFHKDAPKYLNYGGIGMVIGHELTHGFDTEGRQFDKNGNRVRWWTNKTIDAFEEQKKCIVDQYNNYTVTQVDLQVNGEQTQGENIADNGGIKEAFYAYQRWTRANQHVDKKLPGLSKYSAEQMLFVNFARLWCSVSTDQAAKNQILLDVHSPDEFRVLGSTSNFDEFDRVFGCRAGQGNHRVNKCLVW